MDADFLIIGGGIAGISAAARMSELGSVIVLEAEAALAHHASGRSAALFEPRYGAPAVVGLSMASEAYLRSVPGVLSPRGLLLVGKADVREELDRLTAHIAQARTLLADARADNPVGRKFDFLCQEFNREANTLCSKSADIELTRIGIDLKGAVERMREQVQNVE